MPYAYPYTLLVCRCEADRLDRLDDRLRPYRVESVEDTGSVHAALQSVHPDALIAPITVETLSLFNQLESNVDPALRPLLVLIAETRKSGLPADLVLPVRWLDQQLLTALKQRSELIRVQHKLEQEIGNVEAHVEESRRAAREVELLKNAIVRAVSHELKTPLLHVKAAVAMLSDMNDEDRQKLIGYATDATTRLEGVVKNVTQLAEVLEIRLEPARASDAVAQALRNLRRTWEHKDNVDRVHVDAPPGLPLVWADEAGIGIALQHLIDNALKFSDNPVIVTAEHLDTDVVFTVRDTGIGIPMDKLDAIFEPFVQIDNSDARRFGGIGVGLAIVRLILERHHTLIKVESEIGSGSAFSFALPCVE
jgi:signal transduction histidine kinase